MDSSAASIRLRFQESLLINRNQNINLNSALELCALQDPVRSFTGREKYKRPLWVTGALENPSAVRILY